MERVSVCMATYNGGKYIYKQINSILPQLSDTDELIVSDDGSTDDTISVVRAFNDDRIKIVYNKNKKGPVGNFENALTNATGDLMFLADQDDIWVENKIATHKALHDIYDLVISDAMVVDESDEILYKSFFAQHRSKPGFINNMIRNSYIGCCMSFNRKILNMATPFPSYIHMHDWWIGLIAELKGKTYFCNDRLMHYLRHQNNASPTLTNSGYSIFKRFKNRIQLLYGLLTQRYK